MKILVTGANGQLGREMRIVSRDTDHEFVFTDVVEAEGVQTTRLDITDLEAVRRTVREEQIDCIVNCAAYTNVDKAESDEAFCRVLNAEAPRNLAQAMKEVNGLLIHISTDYVFGGDPYNTPCREDQKGTPTGVYGQTKLEGEQYILGMGCKYVILRTAWLYSEFGRNFVKTMLNLTSTKPQLKVVFDQAGTPTYAYDETTQQWLPTTFREIGQLYPERTKTWEVGLDARLWNDLRLSASWYLADTSNQTFQPTVSTSSGYSSMYVQTGCVRNTGVEASLGYGHTWRDFSWDTNVTFTWNRNEILDLMDGMCDPMTGEPLKDRLEIKGLGKAKYILKKGGTMGDLYTTSNLKYDENGYIQVDRNGNFVTTDVGEEIYLGSVLPDYNLAWRNDFSWKGAHLGILFTGRIGGICYSATQANMDLFGVSETSAAARDAGGVLINGREMVDPQRWYAAIASQSGLPHYYTYSATNFRLQELSVGYTLPRRWFRDVCSIDISFVGRNLWMIYCKAPFDPEAIASTGNNYQGIDYFMVPSLRSLGFSLRVTF